VHLNHQLIARLRELAGRGTSVRALVDEIRGYLKTDDGLALVADRYFKEAFFLPVGQVRPIEGSPCLGGQAYSDEQIDRLMLPRIESTRHLWQSRATEEMEAVRCVARGQPDSPSVRARFPRHWRGGSQRLQCGDVQQRAGLELGRHAVVGEVDADKHAGPPAASPLHEESRTCPDSIPGARPR
jgi:hypothetical protein